MSQSEGAGIKECDSQSKYARTRTHAHTHTRHLRSLFLRMDLTGFPFFFVKNAYQRVIDRLSCLWPVVPTCAASDLH